MLLSFTRTVSNTSNAWSFNNISSAWWRIYEKSNLIGEFFYEYLNREGSSSAKVILGENKFEFFRKDDFLKNLIWEIKDSGKHVLGEIEISRWNLGKSRVRFFDQSIYEWKMHRRDYGFLIGSYCWINLNCILTNPVDEIIFKAIYNDQHKLSKAFLQYPLNGTIHVTNSLKLLPIFAGVCLIEEFLEQISRV